MPSSVSEALQFRIKGFDHINEHHHIKWQEKKWKKNISYTLYIAVPARDQCDTWPVSNAAVSYSNMECQ